MLFIKLLFVILLWRDCNNGGRDAILGIEELDETEDIVGDRDEVVDEKLEMFELLVRLKELPDCSDMSSPCRELICCCRAEERPSAAPEAEYCC